ncbi:hypothetical protein HanIR_Chr09g0450601 [Helianthus annuus]|nr:hypothetical protein HanIR_Chr09g0450601 [Helianthus annuus]
MGVGDWVFADGAFHREQSLVLFVFSVGKGLQSADHICRHLQEKRWTKCLQSARRREFVFFYIKPLHTHITHTTHTQTSLLSPPPPPPPPSPPPPSSPPPPLHHRHHRHHYTTALHRLSLLSQISLSSLDLSLCLHHHHCLTPQPTTTTPQPPPSPLFSLCRSSVPATKKGSRPLIFHLRHNPHW